MKTLGELSWEQIGKGLITIAGAFAVVGIAGALLSPLIPSILGLAGAFALFGIATLGIGAGLLAIATSFTALAAAGTAGATAIVAAVTVIVTGLANLIPLLAEKFGEAIVAFSVVIGECAPQLAEAALKLILSVVDSLATYVPQIVSSLMIFLTGLINGIADNLPSLIEAAVNLIGAFLKGIVEALNGIDAGNLLKGIVAVGLLAALMYALSGIVALIPLAMAGVLGIGLVVAEMALVLAAIGALSQIPGLQWLVSEGGDFLQTIGTAIGKFVGGLVGGIAEGVTSTFPDIGTNLSKFMINLLPFLAGASSIDPSIVEGVKVLSKTILIITAANILEGIASFITGGSSLETFSKNIKTLGKAMVSFSKTVSGNINEGAIVAAANAGKALAEMNKTIPRIGGLVSFIAGHNDMATFGTNIKAFGKAIVGFSEKISGNINEQAITAAANAGKTMVELQKTIPKTGGLVSYIVGHNDMATFGKNIKAFGKAMVDFSEKVSGNIDSGAITAAANAGKVMASLQKSVPKSGGLKSLILGDNTLSKFGKSLKKFGESIVEFSDEVKGINISSVNSAVAACSAIITLVKSTSGLKYDGLSSFANNLDKIGSSSVNNFINAFSSSTSRVYSAGKSMTANLAKGIYSGSSAINRSITPIINNMVRIAQSKQSTFLSIGRNMMIRFGTGIRQGGNMATSLFLSTLSTCIARAKGKYPSFYSSGSYLAEGLRDGMESKRTSLYNKGASLAKSANKGFTDYEDINSPSKKWYGFGGYMLEGLINALGNGEKDVSKASANVGKKSTKSLSSALSKVSDLLNLDMDSQPTIRPVVDLSDVADSANTINGMFSMSPSVGVLSDMRGISSMINNIQNGNDNSDLISAVEGLRDDLSSGSSINVEVNLDYNAGEDAATIANDIATSLRRAIRRG